MELLKKNRVHLILLISLLIFVLFPSIIIVSGQLITPLNTDHAGSFDSCQSTDPGNPDLLTEGSPSTSQSYTAGTSYYYETNGNTNPARYHVIWLLPEDNNDDFNLYIYSDSTFNTLVDSSVTVGDIIEWVVFRPSSSQHYFANVTALDNGDGTIEWEDSTTTLTAGTPVSVDVSDTNRINIYMANLVASSTYTFSLTVGPGDDHDLYLYSLASPGSADPTGFVQKSDSGGNEEITGYSPPSDGKVAVLVVYRSGNENSDLTLTVTGGNGGDGPGAPPGGLDLWLYPVIQLPIFFGATFGLVGVIYLYRFIKSRTKPAEEG